MGAGFEALNSATSGIQVRYLTAHETPSVVAKQTEAIFFAGIDVGARQSIVAGGDVGTDRVTVELESNDLGSYYTPSFIAFVDNQRFVGEVAEEKLPAYPYACFAILPLLLNCEAAASVAGLRQRFGPLVSCLKNMDNDGRFVFNFAGKSWHLSASQLLATFLRRTARFAVDGYNCKHLNANCAEISMGRYCLAFPDFVLQYGMSQAVARACHIGALPVSKTSFCGQHTAVIACWINEHLQQQWAELRAAQSERDGLMVLFANAGFAETSLSALVARPKAPDAKEWEFTTVLEVDGSLGAVDLVRIMAQELEAKFEHQNPGFQKCLHKFFSGARWEADRQPTTTNNREHKNAVNLMKTAQKVITDLSGLKSTIARHTIEGVDLGVEVSRKEIEHLASTWNGQLVGLLNRAFCQKVKPTVAALGQAKLACLGIELVGGASRIPFVRTAVESTFAAAANNAAFGRQTTIPASGRLLRQTLDSGAAAAFGAAYLAASGAGGLSGMYSLLPSDEKLWSSAVLEEQTAAERALHDIEETEMRRLALRNSLDLKLLAAQKLVKQRVEGATGLTPLIDGLSDWLNSEEAMSASVEEYERRVESLANAVESQCPVHSNRPPSKKYREKELEAQAREAAKSAGAKETSERLLLAQLHIEDGNDFLTGGNLDSAMERYGNAWSLLEIFSANQRELEEQRKLKVRCLLGMANVHLTDGSVVETNKAVECCDVAIGIAPQETKAYYFRAQAQEKLANWLVAWQNYWKCIQLAQEAGKTPDASIIEGLNRVEPQLECERGIEQDRTVGCPSQIPTQPASPVSRVEQEFEYERGTEKEHTYRTERQPKHEREKKKMRGFFDRFKIPFKLGHETEQESTVGCSSEIPTQPAGPVRKYEHESEKERTVRCTSRTLSSRLRRQRSETGPVARS